MFSITREDREAGGRYTIGDLDRESSIAPKTETTAAPTDLFTHNVFVRQVEDIDKRIRVTLRAISLEQRGFYAAATSTSISAINDYVTHKAIVSEVLEPIL